MAMTAAFWAAPLVQNKAVYAYNWRQLIAMPSYDWFAMDGGLLDGLALVPLLRRGLKRIVVLADISVRGNQHEPSLAYAFGVDAPTATTAMLQGPHLAQVFPQEFYQAVIANLSDPNLGYARLDNLPVQTNLYLGIAHSYVLDSLLILTAQREKAFLGEFMDPQVHSHVRPGWPQSIPLLAGLSALDANLLCTYAGWRVHQARDEVRNLFDSNTGAEQRRRGS